MPHESAAGPLLTVLASILLASCASEPYRSATSYVVRRGDTVSGIAQRYRVDYRELARQNGIGRDYLIYPGQVLRIPGPNSPRRLPPAVASSTPAVVPPPTVVAPPNAPSVVPPGAPGVAVTSAPNVLPPALPTLWVAPAELQSATLVTRPNGSVGLSFTGREEQEILAAADGRVIYTGVGALGYGLLVIIKHTETCLSAYGYTRLLTVREGEDVKAGQPIATMGYEPQGNVALYFEIRINGRTTDPRPLLLTSSAGTSSAATSPAATSPLTTSPVTTTPITD